MQKMGGEGQEVDLWGAGCRVGLWGREGEGWNWVELGVDWVCGRREGAGVDLWVGQGAGEDGYEGGELGQGGDGCIL